MTRNPYALEHSLELYEQYPTVRCRPVCTGAERAPAMRVQHFRWAEICPQKGAFHPERWEGPGTPGEVTLLTLDLTPPAWAGNAEDAPAFVRLLGAELQGGAGYTGVLLSVDAAPEAQRPAPLRAFQAGFDRTALVIRAEETALLEILRREGMAFGILLDVTGEILKARETLAVRHLQRVWENAPLLLAARGCPDAPEALRAVAAGWHALGADVPGLLPGRMALRRLTYPAAVESGGALPLRFWWQVIGDSPIYGRTKVKARLVNDQAEGELALADEKRIRTPGDATHNQIVLLPHLPSGEYALWIAMTGEDERPLPLAIEAPGRDGWYQVGTVTLDDTPRPELLTAWEDYYPEGYYPLEEPKLPY